MSCKTHVCLVMRVRARKLTAELPSGKMSRRSSISSKFIHFDMHIDLASIFVYPLTIEDMTARYHHSLQYNADLEKVPP